MNKPKTPTDKRLSWFEPGKSLEYITGWLQKVNQKIRIATGFFTIKGWNLIRRHTKGKQTYLLVGLDEPGEQRARMALIEEIMRDLRTGLDRDRRRAVLDLVEKIQSNQFEIVDARAAEHHNKLYICDEKAAIQTSSNLTGKGLIEQVEGGNVITKKSEVAALVQEFDEYFASAKDLTEELLDILLRWLQFATPWEIYLKTMLALENVQLPKTRYTKDPVSYQVDMIAQTLRQIREFDGSMVVASTGLGKTIVTVHVALRLREEDLIDNVMIIGPKPVSNTWRKEMREAGLSCEYFVRQTFDQKDDSRQYRQLELFNEILEEVQYQRWLLVIDESHEFRNRYKKNLFNLTKNPQERRAFIRLRELVKKGNLKVLLLTGSPYATNIDNINNQLYLLPHKAEGGFDGVDYFIERCPDLEHLFAEETKDRNAWRVEQIDQFVQLPVVSQLTTPHVAKYYGQEDEQGTYIKFGNQKRYIPKVILHKVNFPLIFGREMTKALSEGYFQINHKNPMFRDLFDRLVKLSWASSAPALQGVLESVADTPGGTNSYKLDKIEFRISRKDREKLLKPLINKLRKLHPSKDIKILALSRILERVLENQQKVIIFCERRPTVVHLYNKLQSIFPSLNIAATIEESEDHQYQMKDSRDIEELIKKFAPVANQITKEHSEDYDIFISTDAHGVGVNMQDASVVINYDIDWTPIGPVQRAGRVLRLWHLPRTLDIYTFVPTLSEKEEHSQVNYDLLEIQKRWNNLMSRHQESRKVIDLPVLTAADIQEIDLSEMASQVTIESGEIDLNAMADLDISPYYQHRAKLQTNRDYAETLPDDLISSKLHSDKKPLLYMLLLHQDKYRGIFYDPVTQQVTEPNTVALLNKIACDEDTPVAHVDFEQVENLSDICLDRWCKQHQVVPDEVERICSLYLKPENQKEDLKELLFNQQSKQ